MSAVSKGKGKAKKAKPSEKDAKSVLEHAPEPFRTAKAHACVQALRKMLPPKELAKGWFSATAAGDSKEVQVAVGAEAKLARATLQLALGKKPVRLVMPMSLSQYSTVTTGVVNTAYPIAVTDLPEWTAITQLFDEYRCLGGDFHFWPRYTSQSFGPSIGVVSVNQGALAMAFDPEDGTSATSVRQLTELAQHKVFSQSYTNLAGSSSYQGFWVCQNGAPYKFSWSLKGVESIGYSATGALPAASAGQWKSTHSTQLLDGFLKPFGVSNDVVASNVVNGIIYLHIEVRSRE